MLPYIKQHIQNQIYVRFHRTDLYEYAKNDYIPFRKITLPHIDWFLPISEDGKMYLLENYSELVNPNKIKVCRLGVFDNGLNPKENAVFHLLSCSNLVSVKRVSLIVDALKLTDVTLKWTHIGAGELYNSILEKAKGLNSNIEVNMLGILSNTEVINYYKSHHIDLFINVSKSEGVPVSIMEALSFGIPVFATSVGGTSEIVDEQVGELLSPDITAKELATKIEQFVLNSEKQNFRINARKRWEEMCNAKNNYLEFVNFLN
jgi:glycosyltransferase involved in cell wall biosynthesis